MTKATTPAAARWKVHAALLVVQIAFASQAVEGKVAMMPLEEGGGGVNPFALAMARMTGAALFFVVLGQLRKTIAETTWRDRFVLAGLSILGISLNQTLFLVGLRHTTPAAASLLSVTIPVFTAALAVVFRVERLSFRLAFGLLLAVMGVLWLTGVRTIDRGALIVSINSLSYSAYIVLSRRIVRRLGALTVVTWIFVWGVLLFAPLGLPAIVANAPAWTARSWMFVGYIVLVPTIVAYLCNAWALARSSPTLVTIYIYVQPLLALVLAWVQLGQPLTTRVAAAAIFIVVGVAVVVTRPRSL